MQEQVAVNLMPLQQTTLLSQLLQPIVMDILSQGGHPHLLNPLRPHLHSYGSRVILTSLQKTSLSMLYIPMEKMDGQEPLPLMWGMWCTW